jgi:ABC-type lipoprotein release transport system permease subunit
MFGYYTKLAWRNIWRNKRRTIITTASVFFGVLLSTFYTSMQEGSYSQYITAIVNSYSGYIQIHKKGYWEDKVINNSFSPDSLLNARLNHIKEITTYAPRLESFSLAASEDVTKGVMVLGIDPIKEDRITNLSGKLKEGEFLNSDDGVLLGSSLAKFLKLGVKDTLVLIGQGYHGASAAGKYPVKGIIKYPAPELDRQLVCMEIKNCQNLFSAQDLVTSIVIMVHDEDEVLPAIKELRQIGGDNLEVMDWQEMNQMLLKQIESDRAGGVITKGILYMIIAFGMLGTVMMMAAERKKEFGVVLAVGMKKFKLVSVIILETIFIGMIGVITGIAASIPVLSYFVINPIPFTGQAAQMMEDMGFEPAMFFSMMPSVFYDQAIIILVFSVVIGIYPLIFIRNLRIMNALHSK